MTGFSNEAILGALGGSLDPFLDAVKAGKIRGCVGIVGCNNPKVQQDSANVGLAKALIAKDILVLATGCAATSLGRAGLLRPEAIEFAGPGFVRLNFGCARALLEKALQRMSSALKRYIGSM